MNSVRLNKPSRIRFVEPDDVEKYGGDWFLFDPKSFFRIPSSDLVTIERTIGMSVLEMIARASAGYTDAALAALWIARRQAGVAEEFADFKPLWMLAESEPVPADDADPPAEGGDSSPTTVT